MGNDACRVWVHRLCNAIDQAARQNELYRRVSCNGRFPAIVDTIRLRQSCGMRPPSPAMSCLIIGAIGSAALWALGERTWGIIGFVADALGWSAIYAVTPERR